MALENINVGTSANDAGIIRYNAFLRLNRNVTETESRLVDLELVATNWGYFVTNAQYTGVDTVVASGIVRDYTLGGNTIYRLVTTAFGPIYPVEDSFYNDFDGVNLTNLLATRGA